MAKINLTESEKNRIRGLHNSHKNQHGTIINEKATGARYGHGFKNEMDTMDQDMGEMDHEMTEMDHEMTETTATSPEDWKMFWSEVGDINQKEILEKFEGCGEKTLADWWRKNSACSSKMNFMQDENCRTSFQEAVNLVGVLACFGVNKISELGSTIGKMAKGLGFGE